MTQIPAKMKRLAGAEEARAGEMLYRQGGVRPGTQGESALQYWVSDTARWEVVFSSDEQGKCTCAAYREQGGCRHVTAAALMAEETGALEELMRRKATSAGPRLMGAMESALPEDGTIRMEITLLLEQGRSGDAPRLRIGLRVGEERLYVVRSIPQMIDAMETGEVLDFGKGFCFHPEWMHFGAAQTRVLDILKALCLAQKEAGSILKGAELRAMLLPEPFAEAILEALTDVPFRVAVGEQVLTGRRVRPARLPLYYRVSGSVRGLTVTAAGPKDFQPLTASCAYALVNGQVVAVEETQRSVMRVMWREMVDGRANFSYPTRETGRVIGELVPFLKLTGVVELTQELEKQLLKLPLVARLYLDRDGPNVVARAQFRYGEREIDPFDETPAPETFHKGERLLLRDGAAERRVLDALGASGFFVSRGRVYLSGQEAIYNFVSEGLARLQALCEVYLSNDFRRMQPRRPLLRGKLRMNGARLELSFTEDGAPAQEILGIMEALSKRRRYFRLKDGSFLDLSAMEEWQPLADSLYEAATLEGTSVLSGEDTLSLRSYRTCYLSSLMELCKLPVEIDASVRETVSALDAPDEENVSLPDGLTLRPYQQRGFRWLHTLDRLRMGGVLADDMGLGKTVQMIALFLAARENGQTSLVIAPTSLTYNWLSELNRFAPALSVMVLSGTGAQRASQIRHLREARDVDVLITSYPLIRRDVDLLKDFAFRFIVLDEAQHIKNAGSVGALAVKQLQAQTRFALTGTPMENGLGELWSIFDFVLPGYLNSYNAFLRRYQDGRDLDDLRRRIRPFLMRRLKKDVLTELPDKIETVMTAQMSPEQGKIYEAAKLRLRDRVDRVMREKGLGRGHTEVLAAITELRQICCHPALVLPDYAYSSGKMELLMEILPMLAQSGHRVLLFSQFTSMLKILRRQIENASLTTMYLDGDTPPAQRLQMTERFNAGEGDVFLISRNAGGTGLNLTGADTVIHYDPWWNPAAEDQATDRAHRIGQTRKVEVIRLVTHESIEEQVVALGQRKRALFDQLITPGEQLLTGLTEQDIRALFA